MHGAARMTVLRTRGFKDVGTSIPREARGPIETGNENIKFVTVVLCNMHPDTNILPF